MLHRAERDEEAGAKTIPGADDLPWVVYSSQSAFRQPFTLFKHMARDLLASRSLGWRLLLRNVRAKYRGSLLGYLWAVLPPLATMLIWVLLNSHKVVHFESPGLPYPVFVLSGLVLWQSFADALQAPLRMVSSSSDTLAKLRFLHEALVLAGLGEVLFNLLVRLALLLGVLLFFRVSLGPTAALALLGIVILIAFGTAVGLLIVPAAVLYKDIGRALTMVLQVAVYLTPVVYPPPAGGPASLLNWLNPVSPLILASRDWLTKASTAHLPGFLWMTGATCGLLLLGWLVFRLAMPFLIERMSA